MSSSPAQGQVLGSLDKERGGQAWRPKTSRSEASTNRFVHNRRQNLHLCFRLSQCSYFGGFVVSRLALSTTRAEDTVLSDVF